MDIYLQGLTMGLAYVAPIGLQNLFVINTALTQKRGRVFLTALIVIFFDITLGLACFLGVGALMQALPWLQKVILAVGSLIVIWIGIGLLRSKATMDKEPSGSAQNVPGVYHFPQRLSSSGTYQREIMFIQMRTMVLIAFLNMIQ